MTPTERTAVQVAAQREPPGIAPDSSAAAEEGWSPPLRFLFRAAAVWLVLDLLPFPLTHLPLTGSWAMAWRHAADAVAWWFGRSLLGLAELEPGRNGSGDGLLDWVRAGMFVALAVIAGALWSAFDRPRPHLRTVHAWLRVYVRFGLGLAMFSYAFAKLFRVQFSAPSDRVFEPLGDLSPMGMLWTFMGSSPGYSVFAGAAELGGALLLFFRRTTTLGALLLVAVMGNVVLLNLCYDVPVKLYSSSLWLMAIFLAAPDVPRLYRAIVLRQALPADPPVPLIRNRILRLAAIAAAVTFVAGNAISIGKRFSDLQQRAVTEASTSPFSGYFEVEAFENGAAPAGDPADPAAAALARARWLRASGTGGQLGVAFADGSYRRFSVDFVPGTTTATLVLHTGGTGRAAVQVSVAQPDPTHVVLESGSMRVQLRRLDEPPSLLLTRGFHWVNPAPLNR